MFQATKFNGNILIFILIVNVAWAEFTGSHKSSNKPSSGSAIPYSNEPTKEIDTFQLNHQTVQEGIKNGWYATDSPYPTGSKDDYEDFQYPPNDQHFESLKTPQEGNQQGWYGTDSSGTSIDLTNKDLGSGATEAQQSQPSFGGNQDIVSTSDQQGWPDLGLANGGEESLSSDGGNFDGSDNLQFQEPKQGWTTLDLPNNDQELQPQIYENSPDNRQFKETREGWASFDLKHQSSDRGPQIFGISGTSSDIQQLEGPKQGWATLYLTNGGQEVQSSVSDSQNFGSSAGNQKLIEDQKGWVSINFADKEQKSQPAVSGYQSFESDSGQQFREGKQKWATLDFTNDGQKPQSSVGGSQNLGSNNDNPKFGGNMHRWVALYLTGEGQDSKSSDNEQFGKVNGLVTMRLTKEDFEKLKVTGQSQSSFGSAGNDQQFGKSQGGWTTSDLSNNFGKNAVEDQQPLVGSSGSQNHWSYRDGSSKFQGQKEIFVDLTDANEDLWKTQYFGSGIDNTQSLGWDGSDPITNVEENGSAKSQILNSSFDHNQNLNYQQGWTALKRGKSYNAESVENSDYTNDFQKIYGKQKLPQGKKLEWTDIFQKKERQRPKSSLKKQNFWSNTGPSQKQNLEWKSSQNQAANWINKEKDANFGSIKIQNLETVPSKSQLFSTSTNSFQHFQTANPLGWYNKPQQFPTIDLTREGEHLGFEPIKTHSSPAMSQNVKTPTNKNGSITFGSSSQNLPQKSQATNFGFVPEISQNIWKAPTKTSYEADSGIVSNDFKPTTPIKSSAGSAASSPPPHSIGVSGSQIVKVPFHKPYAARIPAPHPGSAPIYQLRVKKVEKKVPVVVKRVAPVYVKKRFPVVKHVYIRESEGEWRR